MREVYHHCARAARVAGQKKKEAMYKKKSIEAAGAISKIWEGIQIEREKERNFQEEEKAMKRMMREFANLILPTAMTCVSIVIRSEISSY